jgi:tetratricopeptide (TPR) repeat protein
MDAAQKTLDEALRLLRELGARRFEGYALHDLGSLAEQRGDLDAARGFFEQALALRRDIAYPSGIASTLVALGRLKASQGEPEAAAAHLEEALMIAGELKNSQLIVAATIERARRPGGDVQSALDALAEREEGITHQGKMAARFHLWELTKDKTHLAEAHRLLTYLRDHAPEEHRTSMIEGVPLHRDIMLASRNLASAREGGRASGHAD